MSHSCQFETYPIRPGFAWGVEIIDRAPVAGNPFSPVGSSFRANVRQAIGGPIIGTLTTGTGEITRVDDNTIQIIIPATTTALLIVGAPCLFDLVSTSVIPPEHTNIGLSVPVAPSITVP